MKNFNFGPLIAIGILGAVAVWIGSGSEDPAELSTAAHHENKLASVQFERSQAQLVQRQIEVDGETDASQSAMVKAQQSGQIVAINVKKGQQVSAGQWIVKLDDRDLRSQLKQADALLSQRKQELDATSSLVKKGLQNSTALAQAESLYQQAITSKERVKLQLEHTTIAAPIAGYVEQFNLTQGEFITTGQSVAQILNFEPVLLRTKISENHIGDIYVGQPVTAELVSGQLLNGNITFISAAADPATRTFAIEAEMAISGDQVGAGLTATVTIPLQAQRAHSISPALLELSPEGKLGLKTLSDQDIVEFHTVDMVRSDPSGVWVTGLPATTRIIVVGQGFVATGDRVRAVSAQTE